MIFNINKIFKYSNVSVSLSCFNIYYFLFIFLIQKVKREIDFGHFKNVHFSKGKRLSRNSLLKNHLLP